MNVLTLTILVYVLKTKCGYLWEGAGVAYLLALFADTILAGLLIHTIYGK